MLLLVGREAILRRLSGRNYSSKHCSPTLLAVPPRQLTALWNDARVSDNPVVPYHGVVAPHNFRAVCNDDGRAPQLPDDAALVSEADHPTSLASPHPSIQAPVSRADDGAGWVPPTPGAESPIFAADPSGLTIHLWDTLLGHRTNDSLGVDPSAPGAESSILGAVSSGPSPQGAVATWSPVCSQHPAVIGDIVATADHSCKTAHGINYLERKTGMLSQGKLFHE